MALAIDLWQAQNSESTLYHRCDAAQANSQRLLTLFLAQLGQPPDKRQPRWRDRKFRADLFVSEKIIDGAKKTLVDEAE
jgi:hypothetical protein